MKLFKRQQIYVNTELQFKFSVILIIIVTAEVLIFGGTISYALKVLSYKTAEMIYLFYEIMFIGFIVITVLNIFLGVYLSHKIAGPLYHFEQKLKAITQGDLSSFVELRKGDQLQDFETSFNEMIKSIKRAVQQDREKMNSINEKIKDLNSKLASIIKGKEKEDIKKSLQEISKEMKTITDFFRL